MKRRTGFFALMVTASIVSLVVGAPGSFGKSSSLILRGSFSGVAWRLTGDVFPDGSYCLIEVAKTSGPLARTGAPWRNWRSKAI